MLHRWVPFSTACDDDVVLDTCVLINAWTAEEDLVVKVRRRFRWAAATTLFEFLRRDDGQLLPQSEVERRKAWLEEHNVRPLAWTESASDWLATLAGSRSQVGYQDAHVAAACVGRDFALLTRNVRDFEELPRLRLVDPPR